MVPRPRRLRIAATGLLLLGLLSVLPPAIGAPAAPVVDSRLQQKVTIVLRAMALSDVCDRLRADTGVELAAGRSVADEKVTLCCREASLREVMRQLKGTFGYAWLRSGNEGSYRYELVQDLRSQLLEEELRSRDRSEALLALDREMAWYRQYLGLSPDEVLARVRTAPAGEKERLERFAGPGWGAIQLYFRLSPGDLTTLRSGETVTFGTAPRTGQQPLPADVARGVLQSWREHRIQKLDDGYRIGPAEKYPEGLPPSAVPEARALVTLSMSSRELGQLSLMGGSEISLPGGRGMSTSNSLAVGMNPAVRGPQNGVVNARLSRDPALQLRVTVRPESSCPRPSSVSGSGTAHPKTQDRTPEPMATTADVLLALHRVTGLLIVADFYTRLYPLPAVSVSSMPLFDALNHLADTMHLRWSKDGKWLRFRSASYFHDRLKEVPNRELARWSASRREHGALTLEDLVEIAQLTDPQLAAETVAEGARLCYGLGEWDLVRRREEIRPHLRFLATLTTTQRQKAQSNAGLPFVDLTLAQQPGFISIVLGAEDDRAKVQLEELPRMSLRVVYTQPGSYQWVVPRDIDSPQGWRAFLPSAVRERTREAALLAARRIDPQVPGEQIVPTELSMSVLYILPNRYVRVIRVDPENSQRLLPDPEEGGIIEPLSKP